MLSRLKRQPRPKHHNIIQQKKGEGRLQHVVRYAPMLWTQFAERLYFEVGECREVGGINIVIGNLHDFPLRRHLESSSWTWLLCCYVFSSCGIQSGTCTLKHIQHWLGCADDALRALCCVSRVPVLLWKLIKISINYEIPLAVAGGTGWKTSWPPLTICIWVIDVLPFKC